MKKIIAYLLFVVFLPAWLSSQTNSYSYNFNWMNVNQIKIKYALNPTGEIFGFYSKYSDSDIMAIYRDGIVWGGLFYENDYTPIRVNGSTYNTGEQPGWIENGIPFDWRKEGLYSCRIFRYRKNWRELSFEERKKEAADLFDMSLDEITNAEMGAVLNRHRLDAEEWPAHRGAPYEDINNNGVYEPGLGDFPDQYGADLVIWMVLNDISSRSYDFAGSKYIGLEHKITAWAYEKREGFEGTILERHQLTNHADRPIEKMYIGFWSDPDNGEHWNDYVGCDSILNLCFAYDAFLLDTLFRREGVGPGALGYQLLQGPVIYDKDMVFVKGPETEMTSFVYQTPSENPSPDPVWNPYYKQFYNWLQGYLPTDTDEPEEMYITTDSVPTFFPLAGDPLTKKTNVDGILEGTGDRKMMLNTGPFVLEPGQTVEVVYAITAEISTDHLTSISKLKYNSRLVREGWRTAPAEQTAEDQEKAMPGKVTLLPNYPNPFNGYTKIQFYVEEKGHVLLDVFNIAGERVDVIVDGQAQGIVNVGWHPGSLPSGTYIIRLQAHGMKSFIKAVYIK